MTEVQGPGAEMLHWAEGAYYRKKPKRRQKMVLQQSILPGKKGEKPEG
jgi:hypothetical protein